MLTSLCLVLPFLGAFLSRWHGGGFFPAPRVIRNLCWSFPFALIIGMIYQSFFAGLIILIFCFIGKATGHGGAMDLGHSREEPRTEKGTGAQEKGPGRNSESMEILVIWLFDKLPRYWYDALLLSVIGLFSVLVPAGFLFMINHAAGYALLAGGALGKPLAYMIGWGLYPKGRSKTVNDFNEATAIGELLTGGFAYGGLSFALLIIF